MQVDMLRREVCYMKWHSISMVFWKQLLILIFLICISEKKKVIKYVQFRHVSFLSFSYLKIHKLYGKKYVGHKGCFMYLYSFVQKVFCSIKYIISYTWGVQDRACKSLCKVSDFIQNQNCWQIVAKLCSTNLMKIHFVFLMLFCMYSWTEWAFLVSG
jgi:hypothetical protein